MRAYHDSEWGVAIGSGQLLFRQLVLQTFQAGLSWSIILSKTPAFDARFAGWNYRAIAKWGPAEVTELLADATIVRNKLKIEAVVANAVVASALDAETPHGFQLFCWRHCGQLSPAERLLQLASRSGTHMRRDQDTYTTADGVHPTPGVDAAVAAFKARGFRFLGPATMLSFMQAAGFVNHHKPDCSAFSAAEAAFHTASAGIKRLADATDATKC